MSLQEPGENDPEDYDGYVDYVCGRAPGLDGVTYWDGSRDEPECSCAYVEIGHGLRQRKADPECPVHSPDDPEEVERDRDGA